MTDFYVYFLRQTVLYVDSHRAGSLQGNYRDLQIVKSTKGDDLKQIVKLPARIEYAVSRINYQRKRI